MTSLINASVDNDFARLIGKPMDDPKLMKPIRQGHVIHQTIQYNNSFLSYHNIVIKHQNVHQHLAMNFSLYQSSLKIGGTLCIQAIQLCIMYHRVNVSEQIHVNIYYEDQFYKVQHVHNREQPKNLQFLCVKEEFFFLLIKFNFYLAKF